MSDIDNIEESDTENLTDFCRVCRCGATLNRALFYPCLCTGSIKYVHQDCLMQWLKHSKREFCELCKYKFAFAPIYSADMPTRLPVAILVQGLFSSIKRAVLSWLHYSLVAIAWLLVVPLTACRICRSLFTGSVSSLLTLPLDMLSTDHIFIDCLYGIVVVGLTLGTFVCFMWVREQIMLNGGPEWLEIRNLDIQNLNNQNDVVAGNAIANNVNLLDGARNLLPNVLNAFGAGPENDDIQDDANWNVEDQMNQNFGNENGNAIEAANQENGGQVAGNHPQIIGNQGVGNFNLDWGRGGEELTWEKLIGLDGSLFFLEHVFWIVSLNTLFILVFAFCPYHIGHFTIAGFKLTKLISWTKMDGIITTIIGYVIIAVGLLILHRLLKYISVKCLEKPCHIAGLAFIIIKVALFTILEIGIVPLLCGVWIDICSLSMFNSTLYQRHNLFQYAPATFIFMHWTVGVMYLFYFASFLLLLKEMLRPGIFWFLKNFNDPNFNPIQDMITQSVFRLVKRFCINCSLFGIIIFIMVWIPNKLIRICIPGFLPYKFQSTKDSPMDYSLEILFLQVVLPMLFDGHTVFWLKTIIRFWCITISNLLDLRSFLLGDVPFLEGDIIMNYEGNIQRVIQARINESSSDSSFRPINNNHLATQGPSGNYRPYKKPKKSYFGLRFFALIFCVLISTISFSTIILIVPVYIGRNVLNVGGFDVFCDLVSLLCGLCSIAFLTKASYSLYQKFLNGDGDIQRFRTRVVNGILILWKLVVLGIVTFVWIPLTLGLLINLCVLSPIRVPLDKSIILSFWENWMFGMMHLKIWVMILLFGPRWWFRERLDIIEQELARRENLRLLHLTEQAGPLVAFVTLAITGPFVFSKTIAPIFFLDDHYVYRRIYPTLFFLGLLILIIWFQFRQMYRLYEHIKNERYLVGQQLVNYER